MGKRYNEGHLFLVAALAFMLGHLITVAVLVFDPIETGASQNQPVQELTEK